MTWGQDFLNRHNELLSKGAIDDLMREHYHDDAELVTFEFNAKGKAAIANYLAVEGPAQAGKVSKTEIVALAESDDTIIFTAIVTSEKLGRFVARDALYVKDGKVLKHIALTLPPGKDVKSEWGVTAATPAHQTHQIVGEYFRCVNEADWDGWLAVFDDSAVVEDALSPRMEGKDALRASVEAIKTGFRSFRNIPVEVVVDGDRAMAVCRVEAVTAAGTSIESTGANFYRISGGRVIYMSSYHNPAPFLRAFAGTDTTLQQQSAT
ncbi:MAG: nuclear transport factor 2 family protein [Trebonia sp.]